MNSVAISRLYMKQQACTSVHAACYHLPPSHSLSKLKCTYSLISKYKLKDKHIHSSTAKIQMHFHASRSYATRRPMFLTASISPPNIAMSCSSNPSSSYSLYVCHWQMNKKEKNYMAINMTHPM